MVEHRELASAGLGRYLSHAACLDIDFARGDVETSVERFALERDVPRSLDDIIPFLTYRHETIHHWTVMSTATGLLLWRTLNSVISTVNYIVRKLAGSSLADAVRFPLLTWYDESGRTLLKRATFPDDAVPPNLRGQVASNEFMAWALRDKMEELRSLLEFFEAFNGRKDLTMDAFVVLANRAMGLLRDRYELDDEVLVWSADQPLGRQYLPTPAFSLVEILEADARLAELQALQNLEATAQMIADWRTRFIFGRYQPVFEWLVDQVGDPTFARAAIAIALDGPGDPSTARVVTNRQVSVEDALPAWRLVRSVAAMRAVVLITDGDNLANDVAHRIADVAGLTTPRVVLDALRHAPLSDPASYGRDAALRGIDESRTTIPYARFLERQFRSHLDAAASDVLAFVKTFAETANRPALEFYRDYVAVNGNEELIESPGLTIQAMHQTLANLAHIAMVETGDAADIVRLQTRFNDTFVPRGVPPIDVHEDLRRDYGEVIVNRLRWPALDETAPA